ncbi:TRAP transporter small permease subunit [Albidovulum sp.]|uniref:TRAP transporter small permease subunit n=1 Tax=Albidovulum sp. TaxID=1872424 RepID=UPI001DCB1C03|nr:TRAP transporter small permease subunit [Paracoccaceae bacterium]HPE25077.1 TRAP transporter small permease subunit [Albidovulum sp.]MCB2118532.1 TRAP transporter small permease subunit [Paracoccaceae bacterium]MCB2122713.1 TRAP transporter small permease subunit [Paracoccaceae bacterium]MCB2132605.1 TRAP transporter small permease subunit [Paracoccaceae bacterium]
MQRLMAGYVRFVDRISDLVGYLAASLIFVMAATLILDAFTRNVIKMPVHWAIEFTQFTLAAYYFMGGSITLKNNDHVRMDLIYSHLTDRGRAIVEVVTSVCLLFFLVTLLMGGISSLEYAIATGERRFSVWNPSVIPIKSLMVACTVLMLLQGVSILFKNIAVLRGKTL